MKTLKNLLAFAACVAVVALLVAAPALKAEDWNATQNFIGGIKRTAVHKTAAHTPSLDANFCTVDSSGGAVLVTLPTASTCTGRTWTYLLTTAGNAVSFTPSAVGQLLDNSQAAYAGMDAVGDSVTIYCDGSNFFFPARYIH